MNDDQLDLLDATMKITADEQKAENLTRAQDSADTSWWQPCAIQAIAAVTAGHVFQAYDLVLDVGLAEPHHPGQWGAAFNLAARLGLIEQAGYAASKRPTVAGSAVKIWKRTTVTIADVVP